MADANITRISNDDIASLLKAIPAHLRNDFYLACERFARGEVNSGSWPFITRRMKSGKLSMEAGIRFMAGRIG